MSNGEGNTQPEEVDLPVTRDSRSYQQLEDEFSHATDSAAVAGRSEPERDWYDRTSARLAESRRRWEEEVRLMREQFFSASRPDGALKERAAALLDAHTFDQLHTRTVRRPDGRLGHRVRLDLRGFGAGEDAAAASSPTSAPNSGGPRVTATVAANGPPRRVTVRVSGSCRELVRAVGLPAGCVPGSLTARVTADGVLLIDTIVEDSSASAPLMASPRESTIIDCSGRQPSAPSSASSTLSPSGSVNYDEDETPRVVDRTDGVRVVRLQLRLGDGYRPEEVRVQVSDSRVRVTARHEERTRGRSFFREFQRDCDLPDEVDQDSAVASLTTGGLLIVEAPLSRGGGAAGAEVAAEEETSVRVADGQ